ncbi:hypothetical protein M422DRAFT_246324 [Sphaerobolus stellatus SS14]|nr:hypothetical protein M422DRAFT_246324 [Sphaerobolus stellatus SS14]
MCYNMQLSSPLHFFRSVLSPRNRRRGTFPRWRSSKRQRRLAHKGTAPVPANIIRPSDFNEENGRISLHVCLSEEPVCQNSDSVFRIYIRMRFQFSDPASSESACSITDTQVKEHRFGVLASKGGHRLSAYSGVPISKEALLAKLLALPWTVVPADEVAAARPPKPVTNPHSKAPKKATASAPTSASSSQPATAIKRTLRPTSPKHTTKPA